MAKEDYSSRVLPSISMAALYGRESQSNSTLIFNFPGDKKCVTASR